MLPVNSTNNSVDRARAHAEHLRYADFRDALFVQASNFADFIIIKFGLSVVDSQVINAATLLKHICMIVGLCSEKQVSRIYTRSVIAFMQNAQLRIERAVVQFVRKSVSFNMLLAYFYNSITGNVGVTSPQPAPIGFGYMMPKPRWHRPFKVWFENLQRIAMLTPAFVMGVAKSP